MIFSRRSLAQYAVTQLLDKQPPAEISARLAAALIYSKKQKEADLLIEDIASELESRGLLAKATVTTAHELSSALREELTGHIEKAAKVSQVSLDSRIDENVLGGILVETANHRWDKTIAKSLQDIKGEI